MFWRLPLCTRGGYRTLAVSPPFLFRLHPQTPLASLDTWLPTSPGRATEPTPRAAGRLARRPEGYGAPRRGPTGGPIAVQGGKTMTRDGATRRRPLSATAMALAVAAALTI